MFTGLRAKTLHKSFNIIYSAMRTQNRYSNMTMVRYFGQIINIKLPDLGEGTKEATIKEWFVHKGSVIEEFEDVCEVFTDKLVAQIPSTHKGVIKDIYFGNDDVVPVGSIIADIEMFEDGELPPVVDTPSVVETSSAVETMIKDNSPASSLIAASAPMDIISDLKNIIATGGKVLATPVTRNYAKQQGVDITLVKGTGKEGRVTNENIDVFKNKPEISAPTRVVPVHHPLTGITKEDQVKRIGGVMKGMTKTMTQGLSIPFFVFQDEYDATQLFKLRKDLKASNKNLTLLPFFIKAISLSLKNSPQMNINVNSDTDEDGFIYEYVLKHDHNIGVAIDSPNGLVVPILKRVQDKSILQINEDIIELREKSNTGKLTAEDYKDGTFGVSSVGNLGGTYFVPTILRPMGAIIAIGKASKKPKYMGTTDKGHQWEPYDAVNFSISCDHRVIDGSTCAQFSENIRNLIENPQNMLLNMN
jgi:2-oxoisovalerate dehydrogenase E2 component (dihydrolipoyl transacylase)